ncbi:MAG: GIY-YIG nuclease family protein [Mangrovibacterium sp.]
MQSEVDMQIYIGFSSTLERRIKEHNSGKTPSTKGYCPWNLIFAEQCSTRIEAEEREKFYKSGKGKEILKKMVP